MKPRLSTGDSSPSPPVFALWQDGDMAEDKSPALAALIDQALKARRLSRRGASLKAGLNEHFLRDLISGKVREPKTENLALIAEVTGVPLADLFEALGLNAQVFRFDVEGDIRPVHASWRDPARTPLLRKPRAGELSVRHRVQAGMWLEDDDFTADSVTGPAISADPRYPDPQWLELVTGDSMDMEAPEGSFAHVVGHEGIDRAPRNGELWIVRRVRQLGGALSERSIKQVRKTNGKVELWPRSSNPKWASPLIVDDGDDDTAIFYEGLVIGIYRPLVG